MIQFWRSHIFQMGWWNHQPDLCLCLVILLRIWGTTMGFMIPWWFTNHHLVREMFFCFGTKNFPTSKTFFHFTVAKIQDTNTVELSLFFAKKRGSSLHPGTKITGGPGFVRWKMHSSWDFLLVFTTGEMIYRLGILGYIYIYTKWHKLVAQQQLTTPWKLDMEPENAPLQDENNPRVEVFLTSSISWRIATYRNFSSRDWCENMF